VCAAALGVALDEARGRVWVACLGDANVAVVDVSGAPRLERTLPLDDGQGNRGLEAAYVALDGAHAFVTAQGSGDLWIFDQAGEALVKRLGFESGAFPQRMALVPGRPELLVALDGLEQLALISTVGLTPLDRVVLMSVHPQGIAVTPDGRYAVVSDENDLMHPGRVVRVDLTGLGMGGAHLDELQPARVFPQAVLIIP
jgi:DNA-binding beta-propeller fold protein YncE